MLGFRKIGWRKGRGNEKPPGPRLRFDGRVNAGIYTANPPRRLETGQTQRVELDLLDRIAKALRCKPKDLIGEGK
jgi:hypothetical protein